MAPTPELRIDRLERIAGLFVKAGLRMRRDLQGMDEKLKILVNHQIRNEERFALNEERLAKLAERTDEKFTEVAQKFTEVAEFQSVTDRKFAELMQILRQRQNGNSINDMG